MVKAGYSKNIKPEFRRGRKKDAKRDVAHYGKAKLEVEKDGYMIKAGNKWSIHRRARHITAVHTYYGGKIPKIVMDAAYYGGKYWKL